MTYASIKAQLSQPNLAAGAMFSLLRGISQYVNNKETHEQGRDLVIRALARIDTCDQFEKSILTSLVRNVGLFPYMAKSLEHAQYDDIVAYELHRPDNMDEVFHSLQAKVYYQLKAGSNVVLSASTSAGKSLIIDSMIALGTFRKVVIIVPTLALIDETRKRITRRFRSACHVITHPSQTADLERQNIYILTQERVRHRSDLSNIDFFVVDEFYKLDLRGDDDPRRAIELNLAFHQLANTGAQFYLLGPNVHAIRGLDRYEIHFIPSQFSTVAVDITNFNLPTRGPERTDKLIELCRTEMGPTLIYCQAPVSASRVARALIRALPTTQEKAALETADWISGNFHSEWIVSKALEYGIGIHHGGIPRALQQQMVRLFNDGELPYLICTSTLIEGVNTAAENVVIFDRRLNNSVLDFFTYKNIQGRAGRMGRYFVGKVFVLEKPPETEEFVVDYSIGLQDAETPISLLMQLDSESLTEYSRERVSDELEGSILSADTIRLNGKVSAEVQNDIARELMQHRDLEASFGWHGYPKAPQLRAACDIIMRHLSGDVLRNYRIVSADQLVWHLNSFGISGGFHSYLKQIVDGALTGQSESDLIDDALRVVRNIISFRFPQDLMVIHNIQNEILPRFELKPGDYSIYASAAEGLFLPGVLSALDEYGVPHQIISRVAKQLEPAFQLDPVISRLKDLNLDEVDFSPFEKQLIKTVQDSL